MIDDDLKILTAARHDVSLQVLAELGGKIASLKWNGREVLAQNPRKPFRKAVYGAPYSDYDASGFDECFPTVGDCTYPEPPLLGVELPDHGELWSIPWQQLPCDDGVHLAATGVRLAYQFHRWITLPAPGQVHLRYELVSQSSEPFKCLWSAHALLAIRPGMIIHLPEGVRMKVNWSKGERLGDLLDEHPWSFTTDRAGNPVDLSRILPQDAGLVDKLFTTRLRDGWCVLHDPADGFYVAALFAPEQIPYLGLSINLGGWPVDAPGYYNLGIEPCSGYPDRLDVAMARGDCITLPAHGRRTWEWRLCVGQTDNWKRELERLKGLP
ncbi:MAG: hypothetical protein IT319_06640 [Anaerolineae bacterium]|nr:hypothetical protein [Anaerolineae bacterium]